MPGSLPPIQPGLGLSRSMDVSTNRGGASDSSRPNSRCSSAASTKYSWHPPPATEKGFYAISKGRSSGGKVVKLPSINRPNGRPLSGRSRSGVSLHTPRGKRWRTLEGFVQRSADEDCLKCMLKMPHKKCEGHKYIRVGGGYRHSYLFVRAMLEEIEFQRQQELIRQARLEAIQEKSVRAIKTYIRTKSGRLIEKIIFMNEEDYQAFLKAQAEGKDPSEFIKKYLSKEEADNLESFEKEEQKAIKTYIRTKSGRLIEKLVYVSKSEYEAMKRGDIDAKDLLKKYIQVKDGETIEGWGEAKMRTITTTVRTKSGRLVTKTIQISEEDYQAMMKGGKDVNDILRKYGAIAEGETLEGWEPVKPAGMKVVKTYIRTKSGRLIEKTILMTEEEYKAFQESGGDVNFLKKFLKLNDGEVIEDWEKASTVYSVSDDEQARNAKPGQRFTDKDGNVYEYVVDPITGKKYKKKIGKDPNFKPRKASIDEAAYRRKKQGKRDANSAGSEYSYRSVVSAGGTRRVMRRRRREDGTYSAEHSYHSSQDEEGDARRRRRRRERKHGANSAHSYYSVVSEGGTRHVRRRRRRADGTYSRSESYHSTESIEIREKKKKKARRPHGSGSEHSYYSEVSEGGTHHRKRRKRIRDKDGNVIGYGKIEDYSSSEDENGNKKKKKGRRVHGSDSEHSYFSEVSEGGTHYRKRRKRIRDKDGNIIGYGKVQEYSSSEEGDGKKKKRGKKHHGSDSDYSYFSEVSEGGTRTKKRRLRIRDKDGKVIGHGGVEEYSSSDSDSYMTIDDGKGGKIRVKKPGKKYKPVFSGSDATTDSDIVAERLKNMTEEEREKYLAEREERRKARESKRREKYGDKYEEMMEQHKKQKEEQKIRKKWIQEQEEAKAKAQSMVSYEKNKGRDKDDGKTDSREIGLAHEDWGTKKKGGKKGKDGHEADDESEGDSQVTGKKKKGGRKGSSSSFSGESVYSRDADGNLIKKKIKRKGGKTYEYIYDEKGNLIKKVLKAEESDDGDYFEIGEDGKLRLKKGKKRIDLTKLTDDQLRALGIDPTLSKSEIKRLLMEKFGDQIEIVDRGKKIGMKTLADYGSDVGTDELADDSDFDVSTLKGVRRVNVKMRRGGQQLWDHLKRVLEQSKMKDDEYAKDLDEQGEIDFLNHYRLVDPNKVEMYAKAFVCEDEDFDCALNYREMKTSLEGVPTIQHLTRKQMDYVLGVLKINDSKQVTFKMFAVAVALGERITQMDSYCKHLIEIANLMDIERKVDLYKAMFYCNQSSDRDANFITSESLRIELMAGGLSWKQQEYIMDKMQPNNFREISFLDYMAYIPLFLSMHENICDNPLDMSDKKYQPPPRKLSIQRDMNPLGYHLKNNTPFVMRRKANELLESKTMINVGDEERQMLEKFSKMPSFIAMEGTPSSPSKPGAGGKAANPLDDWSKTNIFADDD
ncbi:uncharacterized protein LOC141902071 [Tubulanus polymorphus]|uniref:uncharacterized protein LOC141902071 n=1 Tax=Tubulanus polymorphus TaxID=672921 RepID=UPI003DA45AEF